MLAYRMNTVTELPYRQKAKRDQGSSHPYVPFSKSHTISCVAAVSGERRRAGVVGNTGSSGRLYIQC